MTVNSAMRLPTSATRYESRRHIKRQAREIEQLRHTVEISNSLISQLKSDVRHERNYKEGFEYKVKLLKQKVASSPSQQKHQIASPSSQSRTATPAATTSSSAASAPVTPPATPPAALSEVIEYLTPLTKEEKEQLLSKEDAICFRCRRPGHKSSRTVSPDGKEVNSKEEVVAPAQKKRRATQQDKFDQMARQLNELQQVLLHSKDMEVVAQRLPIKEVKKDRKAEVNKQLQQVLLQESIINGQRAAVINGQLSMSKEDITAQRSPASSTANEPQSVAAPAAPSSTSAPKARAASSSKTAPLAAQDLPPECAVSQCQWRYTGSPPSKAATSWLPPVAPATAPSKTAPSAAPSTPATAQAPSLRQASATPTSSTSQSAPAKYVVPARRQQRQQQQIKDMTSPPERRSQRLQDKERKEDNVTGRYQ
ncbi:hypothetical protein LTR27_010939 [Elasticomyces elasticus]|nr:hypothetical protein LTR27_010939 [Elasticomyces elasticus]